MATHFHEGQQLQHPDKRVTGHLKIGLRLEDGTVLWDFVYRDSGGRLVREPVDPTTLADPADEEEP